jgi:hypothetical protein
MRRFQWCELGVNPRIHPIEVLTQEERIAMTAITASAYPRTAPRGAVIAAEVFTWVLRAITARRPGTAADAAVQRVAPASFPA